MEVTHRISRLNFHSPGLTYTASLESPRSMRSRPAICFALLLACTQIGKGADFDRCSACQAIATELRVRLEKETPKNHLDMRHRLDKEGKRWGKVIDYRLSELRALTILEGLCGGLNRYRLVDSNSSTPGALQVWQNTKRKPEEGLEGQALSAHQQAHTELRHYCHKILESHEDNITAALQEEGSPLLAGAEELLCQKLTIACKPAEPPSRVLHDAYDDNEL